MVGFDRGRAETSAERLHECRQQITGPVTTERGWAPAHLEMNAVLLDLPEDIAGVVARLKLIQSILDSLPPSPGTNRVAAFNALYLTITEQVEAHLRGPDVTDPIFLEMLDVEFARLYFTALGSWGAAPGVDTPDAWEVLFRRAHDSGVSPLEAAVLGVNAHINHDLALALIATWQRLGYPGDGPQHPDYLIVNQIFYQHIPPLRRRFATAWQMQIDRCVGDLDDWSQRILVYSTRALAWEKAERLWELQDDKEDYARALLVMDRVAAVAGETVLTGAGIVRVLWLAATAWVKGFLFRVLSPPR
ncbi:DUF5995 family protein [Actinoplanes derwentensis]|uniref:DUF5995 family protein n=1 Tax=Actinoplanes derwentensis TaxID=113562 RepID=UPI001E559A63|nr:DUF5995 family protein [Actinoplanes derwentensis]